MKHTQSQGQKAHSYSSSRNGCIEIAVGHKTIARIWDHPEAEANAERILALWNAANGMPTEEAVAALEIGGAMQVIAGDNLQGVTFKEAVKYIEHGREMVELLRGLEKAASNHMITLNPNNDTLATIEIADTMTRARDLLTKLEAK